MNNCILIGVAGGSGSGKTTVANNLVKAFKVEDAALVEQDAYYKELTNRVDSDISDIDEIRGKISDEI